MSCCISYLDLGCYASCGTLTLDATATATGNYSVHVEGGYAFNVATTIGEAIEIDLSNFNEDSVVKFQVYDTTGTPITITDGGTDYTCFKVKTSIVLNVTAMASDPDECCGYTLIQVSSDQTYYTLVKAQWEQYGAIPTIEVYVDYDGNGYTQIQVNQEFDTFPNPNTITVTLPGSAYAWYIKIS